MTPGAYCRKRTLGANTSFYYPIALLSADRRAAMYALYAFCREVDDTVDDDKPQHLAREQLEFWRQDLKRAFANGAPEHPVCQELARVSVDFALPQTPFFDIIDGMEMDLDQQRYADKGELAVYCSKVAVAVGQIIVHIFCFGKLSLDRDKQLCDRFANHLGMAFQLTNILRDIKEDALRGRVYIPNSLLAEHALSAETILAGRWSQSLSNALTQLGDEAEEHFQAGEGMIVDKKLRKCLFPALLMSGIYHRYLIILRQRGFDSLSAPVKLSAASKLALTVKIWLREIFSGH